MANLSDRTQLKTTFLLAQLFKSCNTDIILTGATTAKKKKKRRQKKKERNMDIFTLTVINLDYIEVHTFNFDNLDAHTPACHFFR